MPNIAWIDLTKNTIRYTELDPNLTEHFLGGRGLGAKLLFDAVGPDVKPFDPENCIIFTTAPSSGRPWPTSSRIHATFKSPATGAYGYANAGGHVGAELARAGFNAMVITGQSQSPVYLEVTQDNITIRPAQDLWGLGTYATQE